MEFFFACGILDFGMQDTAQRIFNPTNDWNQQSKSHLQLGIHTEESGIHSVVCEQSLLFRQAPRGFPACSRVLAFTRLNRRACSQATHAVESKIRDLAGFLSFDSFYIQ